MTEKPWGKFSRVAAGDNFQVDYLQIKPGGHSSIHWHENMTNVFVVTYGELQVETYPEDEEAAEFPLHILTSESPPLEIPAGLKHRFVAATEVHCVEVCRALPGKVISVNDIHRVDEGGVNRGLIA